LSPDAIGTTSSKLEMGKRGHEREEEKKRSKSETRSVQLTTPLRNLGSQYETSIPSSEHQWTGEKIRKGLKGLGEPKLLKSFQRNEQGTEDKTAKLTSLPVGLSNGDTEKRKKDQKTKGPQERRVRVVQSKVLTQHHHSSELFHRCDEGVVGGEERRQSCRRINTSRGGRRSSKRTHEIAAHRGIGSGNAKGGKPTWGVRWRRTVV